MSERGFLHCTGLFLLAIRAPAKISTAQPHEKHIDLSVIDSVQDHAHNERQPVKSVIQVFKHGYSLDCI